jgi:hypothetical protein
VHTDLEGFQWFQLKPCMSLILGDGSIIIVLGSGEACRLPWTLLPRKITKRLAMAHLNKFGPKTDR